MQAIRCGKLATITQGLLEHAVLLVDQGKIIAFGTEIKVPDSGVEWIDAEGCYVMPGLIDAHSHLGVNSEFTAGGHDSDCNEVTDPVTPHLRIIDSFNPMERDITIARDGGFTLCCTFPGSANIIGGTGFAYKLRQTNDVERMAIPGCTYMKMALGQNPKSCYGTEGKAPMTRMATAAILRETLHRARQYADKLLQAEQGGGEPPEYDPKLHALVPVVRGEMKARIHCHQADDICTAIRICGEFGLDFAIEHCTEGYQISDVLVEHQVACVVGPMLMPPAKVEVWDTRQDTPARLEQAGLHFCLTADSMASTRYLPHHIGLCMARGLSERAAFESVTINPARLLGVADRVGSIEVGKDADLAVFDGLPFSNMSRCKAVMIDGEWMRNDLQKGCGA